MEEEEIDEKEPKGSDKVLTGENPDSNLVRDVYLGTAEQTEMVSTYVSDTYYRPYNPDDLYQKTGNHQIYTEMSLDDQVSACLQLKKDLMIGSGWDIMTEDEGDQEVADKMYCSLEEDPDQSFDDDLDTFVDNATIYGFALAEKLFKKKEDGMITLKSLKSRHPDTWLIHTDVAGNIEKYEQRQSNGSKMIDPKTLLYYTPTGSTVSPYGLSDLRKVYQAYFTKRHITRFYSIFLEGAAKPIPVGKYEKNLPDNKVTELLNILQKFQAKTAIVAPKDVEIEFLEAKSTGEAYIKGINQFNMFIGRGLFVPDLLGFTGEGSMRGGSQALGREQIEVFMKHIMKRRRSIERLVNKQIIQPMIIHNYGFMEKYPKFQFKPVTEEDTKEYARIFIEAIKGKFYNPSEEEINHLRSLLKFPEGEVDLIPSGAAGGGTPPLMGPDGQPLPPDEQPEQPDGNEPEPEETDEDDNLAPGEQYVSDVELSEDGKLTTKGDKFVSDNPIFKIKGNYASRTNFKLLEETLNASEEMIIVGSKGIVNEIIEDMWAQVKRKRILGADFKPEKIREIKLKKLPQLQKILNKSFKEAWEKHYEIAKSELVRSEFATPIPSEAFIELLKEETWDYIGDWEYKMLKDLRVALQEAIRDGKPIESVIADLDPKLRELGETSIRRYARTKHTEVMNRSRVALYEDSRVVDAYQFIALMDGRTSAICSGLHGKIFQKGSQPVPPLHFNCRSTLVPITIFQDKTIDTEVNGEAIDQFIEANKGSGFSVY